MPFKGWSGSDGQNRVCVTLVLCTDENTIDIKATVACGEDGR